MVVLPLMISNRATLEGPDTGRNSGGRRIIPEEHLWDGMIAQDKFIKLFWLFHFYFLSFENRTLEIGDLGFK